MYPYDDKARAQHQGVVGGPPRQSRWALGEVYHSGDIRGPDLRTH